MTQQKKLDFFSAFTGMDNPMAKQPLAEVFGFKIDDQSDEAKRYRHDKLCPYNNIVASCTKDKVNDPLGVCSIYESKGIAIVCPVRFREGWKIVSDAARFLFPEEVSWTHLSEIRLYDANGKSAGNIDHVLVAYDQNRRVTDFGSLEVQGVYISGNLRRPFAHFMATEEQGSSFDWSKEKNYPSADWLSSSRKRLAPQLLYKGMILHSWQKKMTVAIDSSFLAELPELPQVSREEADVAWLVYDLKLDDHTNRFQLIENQVRYTKFKEALDIITQSNPGKVEDFVKVLEKKLKEKLTGTKSRTVGTDITELFDGAAVELDE